MASRPPEIAFDTSSQRNTICIINGREPLVTRRPRYNHIQRHVLIARRVPLTAYGFSFADSFREASAE